MERRLRLRESSDIKRVRGRGMAVAEGPFVARVLPNRLDPPQNRYTVVAGKKQGNAVKRNRVKRLAREALRHLDPLLVSGVDVLILVRGKAEEVPDYATARALLDRIVARAGLLAEPRPGDRGSGASLGACRPAARIADPAPAGGGRPDGNRAGAKGPRTTEAGAAPAERRPDAASGGAAGCATNAAPSAGGERSVAVLGGAAASRELPRPSRRERQATKQGADPAATLGGRADAGDPGGDGTAGQGGAR